MHDTDGVICNAVDKGTKLTIYLQNGMMVRGVPFAYDDIAIFMRQGTGDEIMVFRKFIINVIPSDTEVATSDLVWTSAISEFFMKKMQELGERVTVFTTNGHPENGPIIGFYPVSQLVTIMGENKKPHYITAASSVKYKGMKRLVLPEWNKLRQIVKGNAE